MKTLPFDPSDIGAVVDTMYAMISGPAGPRDWALPAEVFHPESRQIRTWIGEDRRPRLLRGRDRPAHRRVRQHGPGLERL